MLSFLLIYLAIGLIAGFVAGLLGVGGGLILVPVLSWAYAYQGFPAAYNIHMALGTSLGTILFTAVASLRAHHGHGAVRWEVVRRITPGIVLGTLAGALAAARLPGTGLRIFFTLFLFYAATQMLLGSRPRAQRQLPGWAGMSAAGFAIGLVSSWVGIGGGTLSVPFLVWCKVRFQEAIGTSAAIGLPIALAGAAGYAWSGQGVAGLPDWSLGFIHLPALAAVALMSIVAAPWGARLTHRLPVTRLRRIFAALLYLLGLRMAWSMI